VEERWTMDNDNREVEVMMLALVVMG